MASVEELTNVDLEKQQLIELTPTIPSTISYRSTDEKWQGRVWKSRRKPLPPPPPPVKPMKTSTLLILVGVLVATLIAMIVMIVVFEQCRMTKCQSMQTKTDYHAHYEFQLFVGKYIPQCDANGDFKLQQCHGSTGFCWCVNKYGDEIPGTRRGPSDNKIDCSDGLTKCQMNVAKVNSALLGAFIPHCDVQGAFYPRQCHSSVGHCWCVNEDGDVIEGTSSNRGEEMVVCPKGRKQRAVEKHETRYQVAALPLSAASVGNQDEKQQVVSQSKSSLNASSWEALAGVCGRPVVEGPNQEHNGSNIVNGHDVDDIRRWPWAAYLGSPSSSFYCGAELIASQWVLTAAHCVSNQRRISITLGTTTRNSKSSSALKISASEGFIHPDYDVDYNDYDVGLLKLYEPVKISDYIKPVCLASSLQETVFYKSNSCWKVGWGKTGRSPWFSQNSDILQEINPKLISPKDCLNYFRRIHNNMICSSNYGDKGACSGDSGGPMMCKNQDGAWDLVGTTSWGINNCGDPDYADVMARTSTARDWIINTINSNGGPGEIVS